MAIVSMNPTTGETLRTFAPSSWPIVDGQLAKATLAFEVPVALPPPGRYRAMLQAPIAPGSGPARPLRAVVQVGADGTLQVGARSGIPAGGRLRVAFVRPA